MKTLSKYFINRKATINSLLKKPNSKYTSGTFHTLRVEIKKLNALFDLINFCEKDFQRKKYFEPFKLIFRQAGKVRELQLEEAMLKKYIANNLLNVYRNSIKKQRLKEQDAFFLIVNKKFTASLKNKYHKIVPFLGKVNTKKANRYLEEKENSIKKLLGRSTLQTQQVHELRKRLKMFNYNIKSLPLAKQKQTTLKKDVLPGLLGRWHDCQVMTRHLENALEVGRINPKEINQLEKVKSKIDSDSEILFSKINATIAEHRHFLNKFTKQLH